LHASSLAPKSLYLLGVRVHNVTKSEALALLEEYAASGVPHHVVTLNPEYLVQAHDSPQFQQVLNQADLALADGSGLMLASRLLGSPLVERLPGVDLIRSLAALAAARGFRLFLLGAGPGVAEAATRALVAQYPRLVIAGTYAGSPNLAEEEEIRARIRAAQPHFLFVAYGSPQQDFWIQRNLDPLGVPVAMGVGGALDYLSGRVARAPRWMRAWGLEWLYRLGREPWRWRRMLRLPRFLWLVLRERFGKATAKGVL
jgi:N-acetylglucosaminyldiphosphoundecaprenol N-acetyl-beta-D-mannosaminyltransferase